MKTKLRFFVLSMFGAMLLIQMAWSAETFRIYDNKDGKYVNVSPTIYDAIKREGSTRYGPEPGKLFAPAPVSPPGQFPDKPSDTLTELFNPANTITDPNPPKSSGNETSVTSVKVEERSIPAKINGENKEIKYTVPVLPVPPPVPSSPGTAVDPPKTIIDRLFNRNKR